VVIAWLDFPEGTGLLINGFSQWDGHCHIWFAQHFVCKVATAELINAFAKLCTNFILLCIKHVASRYKLNTLHTDYSVLLSVV